MKARRIFLVITAAVALGLAAPPAGAQQPSSGGGQPSKAAVEEARQRYERGTQLYKEGDYKLALIEFQRAYDLAPNYRLLYNIGQLNYQLNNYADAYRALERYLAEGGNNVPIKRRQQIRTDLTNLKSRTALVQISTNVEGAEITIDDTVVGKTPLPASVLVDVGRHKIIATKEGRSTATKTVNLAGGDSTRIDLELPEVTEATPATPPSPGAGVGQEPPTSPPPEPPPSPPLQPQPDSTQETSSSKVWIGWTVTGVLAAGAVGTGIAALVSSGDLSDTRDSPDSTREDLDSKRSQAFAFAVASDVLTGAAVVSGVISLVLTLSDGSSAASKPSDARAGVRVGVGPTGVSLGGRF